MALLNRSNKATLRTSRNRKLVREASVSTRQHHSWDRPDNLRCQLRYSDFLCTASATKFLRMIQTFMDSGIFFVQKAQQSFYSEQNQELTAFRFLLSFHLGQHNRQYNRNRKHRRVLGPLPHPHLLEEDTDHAVLPRSTIAGAWPKSRPDSPGLVDRTANRTIARSSDPG